VIVAASSECFTNLPLDEVFGKIVDLEYSSIELALHEQGNHLKPSEVLADFERAYAICSNTRRLDVVAYSLEFEATGDTFYEQFTACCKLAKATKVVTLTVPSGELGTPFNEEVEKLRKMVAIAALDGIRVSMKSQTGRMSEDPDTVAVLCDNVEGLGLTLDPSHYICGPHKGRNFDKLMKYVCHVHLRDTSKEEFQVRIGQGEVDYGRLVGQLRKMKYNRALSVHLIEKPDVEHRAEMRKMRLLLESLFI